MDTSINLAAFRQPLTAFVQGASRGIGLAFVRHLSASGDVAVVYAGARNATSTEALRKLAADTRGVRPIDADVTDEISVSAAAARVHDDGAQVDLLINCAGLLHIADGMQPERRLADVDPDNMVLSYRVNALGPLLIAKYFAALLPRDRHCVFASLSARVGSIADNRLGGWYAYRAAKAAQNQITRTLSIELRRRAPGSVCVALHPGTVATGLSAPFTRRQPPKQLFAPEEAAGRLLGVIGRLGEDDTGRFIAYDGSEIPW